MHVITSLLMPFCSSMEWNIISSCANVTVVVIVAIINMQIVIILVL